MQVILERNDVLFTVHHADHGLTQEQTQFALDSVSNVGEGFFIKQVEFPEELGSVPCALYGPAMGDEPVKDEDVMMLKRGDRPWKDRMMVGKTRPVQYVQVIGKMVITPEFSVDACSVFTIYGGPLAPQNPQDPSCPSPEKSADWWSQHALVDHS